MNPIYLALGFSFSHFFYTIIDLILLVLAGKFYFKEKQGWERIIAAVIVYAGIQLILLFG